MGTPADELYCHRHLPLHKYPHRLWGQRSPPARKGPNSSGLWTLIRNPSQGLPVCREACEGPRSGWESSSALPSTMCVLGPGRSCQAKRRLPRPRATHSPAEAHSARQTVRDLDLWQICENQEETESGFLLRGANMRTEETTNDGDSSFCF